MFHHQAWRNYPQNLAYNRHLLQGDNSGGLTPEHNTNYVPVSFVQTWEPVVIRSVVEEAMALASITLFLAMVAIWAQVLGVL
jgi:hypothetical protein